MAFRHPDLLPHIRRRTRKAVLAVMTALPAVSMILATLPGGALAQQSPSLPSPPTGAQRPATGTAPLPAGQNSAARPPTAQAPATSAAPPVAAPATAVQEPPPPLPKKEFPLLAGRLAFGDYNNDEPGVRRVIRIADLPAPTAIAGGGSEPRMSSREPGQRPTVPPGFSVTLFAQGLRLPRMMKVAPDGMVLVPEATNNRIVAIKMPSRPGSMPLTDIWASSLARPYGLDFWPPGPNPTHVLVAETLRVVRLPYQAGQLRSQGQREVVVPTLPQGTGNWERDVAITPDGKQIYISVGSSSSIAPQMIQPPLGGIEQWDKQWGVGAAWGPDEKRGAVLIADATPPAAGEENKIRIFANGLRLCTGLTLHPRTGQPWCTAAERDGLGADVPPDFVTQIRQGGFYGWPWFYSGGTRDPRVKLERNEIASKVIAPDVLLQAHSAPFGLAFYTGTQFPADFRGDAFVALRGSWDRLRKTGFKVVRIRFNGNRPMGEYEDFMTGFVDDKFEVWGRPSGVAVAIDGSLLVADDGSGSIWRVMTKEAEAQALAAVPPPPPMPERLMRRSGISPN